MLADCRLQKVEEETRHLHYYLDETDECFFIGEYTSGKNYAYSQINQLISNLKKEPAKQRTKPMEYKYKLRAIADISACFRRVFKQSALNQNVTIVPIPPSKTKAHPEYDDRMLRVCVGMVDGFDTPDLAELIQCKVDMPPTHQDEHKPPPNELIKNYKLEQIPGYQPREFIFLVDDMLTTGTHFKACKNLILQTYPNARVVGVFVSRRVEAPVEWPDMSIE